MPTNSKKSKKKSKSKSNNSKKQTTLPPEIHAQVFDESDDYPTSRVIKRAPNGDVIVESMSTNDKTIKKKRSDKKEDLNVSDGISRMTNLLDLHWESLSANEKKEILRIDKNDVFHIIQKYQSDHSCNCSVCGKRHITMDQEMERIYNMLYEIDKIKDPEINPIKFHLSIIKDLQISKSQNNNVHSHSDSPPVSPQVPNVIPKSLIDQSHEDEDLKEFLSSNNANTLKEEVLHFKQAKQLEQKEHRNKNNNITSTQNEPLQQLPSPLPEERLQRNHMNQQQHHIQQRPEQGNPESSYIEDKLLKGKYLQFTQKYISSHPKIAEEYVKRVMMYPEMRHVTDQLMSSDGDGFLKAIENFVIERARDEDGNIDEGYYQKLGDVRSFTTMLHKGQPLTQQEYADLQRNIAERMTSSYDTKRKEFREISPLEKELFARFMFGEDREQFGEMVMQSFREKFDHEFGGASVSASLAAAAAAATLTNPLNGSTNHHTIEADKDEFDDSYDYSDYDEDEEDDSDFLSEYTDEDEEDISDYGEETDSEHECSDPNHHHSSNQMFTHNREHIEADDREHFHHGEDSHHMSHDEDYESEVDEATRLEEGRKLIQIAITKLLQGRILESYHTKQADVNRLKLLQELEDEKEKKRAKEEKKLKKKEKEKEKKKIQQQAKEEERRRKLEEEERRKKESEQREIERRETQRKKVEEAKKKKDEERRRRLEEQKKREEQQEKQRKLKEEMKKKKEEERKEKERVQKEKEEIEERKRKEQKREEERLIKEKEAKELRAQAEKQLQEKFTLQSNEDELIKQTLSSVSNNPIKSNTFLFNSSQASSVDSDSLLGNASGRNINTSSSNSDILSMLGTPSLVPPPPEFNNSSLLSSSTSTHQHHNALPSSQPVSSSVASNLLPSSLWGNINSSQPNGPMFNTSPGQSSSLLSSLNNPSFTPVPQPLGVQPPPQTQQDNIVPKSLSDELNSLTSMLNSTNINDQVYSSNNTFGGSSLWGDSQLAGNTNNGGTLFSANASMRQTPHASNPLSFTDHSFQHRKSIWNDNLPPVNSIGISTTPNNMPLPLNNGGVPMSVMDNTANNNINAFAANNGIWNTGYSNTPPTTSNSLGLGTAGSLNAATQHPHHPLPQRDSISHGTPVLMNSLPATINDHAIFDLICDAYATVIQTQPTNHTYVPIDTLYHQFSMSMQLDYHTFVNKLLEMRILHGCEILNSSVGTISHVKISLDTIAQRAHSVDHSVMGQGNLQQVNGQAQMAMNPVGSNSS
ncbi:stress response protein Nst1p [Monosporozyma servazzii]